MITPDDIKRIAAEITTEQFEELVGRFCVREAKAMETDFKNDFPEEHAHADIDLYDNACFVFYEGMHREGNVAKQISQILAEDTLTL